MGGAATLGVSTLLHEAYLGIASYLGRAYFTLGLALQGQGKSGDARAAFRSAVAHLEATLGPGHPDTRRARQLAASETQHQ